MPVLYPPVFYNRIRNLLAQTNVNEWEIGRSSPNAKESLTLKRSGLTLSRLLGPARGSATGPPLRPSHLWTPGPAWEHGRHVLMCTIEL